MTNLNATDNGAVTFSDATAAQNIVIPIVAGVLSATTVNLSAMAGKTATATLTLNPDASGHTFTPVASNAVTIDPGPTAEPVASSVDLGGSVNLTSAILAAAKAGLKGDTLTVTADNTTGTAGQVSLVNGQLTYTATGAGVANIPANGSQTDTLSLHDFRRVRRHIDGDGDDQGGKPGRGDRRPALWRRDDPGDLGRQIVNAYGWYNTIYEYGGNDIVNSGQGNAKVYAGSGDVVVNLNGYYDIVCGGNGNDTVSGSLGNATITLGNGVDAVSAGGYWNSITLGPAMTSSSRAGERFRFRRQRRRRDHDRRLLQHRHGRKWRDTVVAEMPSPRATTRSRWAAETTRSTSAVIPTR